MGRTGLGDSDFLVLEVRLHKGPRPINDKESGGYLRRFPRVSFIEEDGAMTRSFRLCLSRSTSLFSEYDRRINIHRAPHWLPGCDNADGCYRHQSASEGQGIERLDAVERRRNDAS